MLTVNKTWTSKFFSSPNAKPDQIYFERLDALFHICKLESSTSPSDKRIMNSSSCLICWTDYKANMACYTTIIPVHNSRNTWYPRMAILLQIKPYIAKLYGVNFWGSSENKSVGLPAVSSLLQQTIELNSSIFSPIQQIHSRFLCQPFCVSIHFQLWTCSIWSLIWCRDLSVVCMHLKFIRHFFP